MRFKKQLLAFITTTLVFLAGPNAKAEEHYRSFAEVSNPDINKKAALNDFAMNRSRRTALSTTQDSYGVLVTENLGDFRERITFYSTRSIPTGTMFFKELEFSVSTELGFAEKKTFTWLMFQVNRDLGEGETFYARVWNGNMGELINGTDAVKVSVFTYNPKARGTFSQVSDYANASGNVVERTARFQSNPTVNPDGTIEVKLDRFDSNTTFLLDKFLVPRENVQDKGGGNYVVTPPFKVSLGDHLLSVGTAGGSDTIGFRNK